MGWQTQKNSSPAPCNMLMRPYVTVTARFLVATPDRLPRFAQRTATGTAGLNLPVLTPADEKHN
jgi:hypothetical protein